MDTKAPPMPQPVIAPRARAVLAGLAVGDALGTTLEFSRPPARPWSTPLTGPHQGISGGGPFAVLRGQVTDDTQMACCLFRALRASPEDPSGFLAAVASSYHTWSTMAFDIGTLTAQALASVPSVATPDQAGRAAWLMADRQPAGNGSLMRTAVIGALTADARPRMEFTLLDGAITHADPRCQFACLAFNEAVAAGVAGAEAPAMALAASASLDQALEVVANRHPVEERPLVIQAHAELSADLAAARLADPGLDGALAIAGPASGFVRVAFRLAFWQLLHAQDFKAGLLDTVNRGGDADTNGAIVGALLAARDGWEAIPQAWLEVVGSCDPRRPWQRGGPYHPALFLAG